MILIIIPGTSTRDGKKKVGTFMTEADKAGPDKLCIHFISCI